MRELFDEVNRDWEEHECRRLYTKGKINNAQRLVIVIIIFMPI